MYVCIYICNEIYIVNNDKRYIYIYNLRYIYIIMIIRIIDLDMFNRNTSYLNVITLTIFSKRLESVSNVF